MSPTATTCRYCASPVAWPAENCGSEECREREIREQAAFVKQRKLRHQEERSGRIFRSAAEQIAAAAAHVGACEPWLVPAQSKPVEPLPPERREAFVEHLHYCVEFAEQGNRTGLASSHSRKVEEEPEAPLSQAACATCQGKCCKRGGDTALLMPSDLGRWMDRRPGSTGAEAIDAYLAHLPERSVRGACVYQGEAGCALPRAMRQDICNSYHCDALRWLNEAHGPDGSVVLVAAEEDEVHRVAAFTGSARVLVFEHGDRA